MKKLVTLDQYQNKLDQLIARQLPIEDTLLFMLEYASQVDVKEFQKSKKDKSQKTKIKKTTRKETLGFDKGVHKTKRKQKRV